MPVKFVAPIDVVAEVARLEKGGYEVQSVTPGAPHGTVYVLYRRKQRKRPDQKVETRAKPRAKK